MSPAMTTGQPWPQSRSRSASGGRVRWMEPEGPHSVENIDQRRYHAIRVELKEHPSHDRPGSGLE